MLCFFEGGGRVSPRRARYLFFASPKKSTQKKGDPQSATPAGQTCGGALAGRAVELALRCARRSDSHGESVHEAWALRRPCSPRNRPAAGAASRGGTAEHPNSRTAEHPFGPSLRSAWPAQRVALAPARWGRAKQRPVWMFCPLCPSGCAEERRGWRIRARVCLSDAQRRELSEAPPNPSTAGCPVAKRRGRRRWGRPFFGSFLSATRKKGTRMPGDSRPPPLAPARRTDQRTSVPRL